MRIINFTASTKNGVIKIPKEFLKNIENKVHVIIVVEKEEATSPKKKKKHLTALSVDTKGLKINRVEANVRKIFS